MARIGVDSVHLASIVKDVTCIRIRPEEVAGACLEASRPVGFTECQKNGQLIMAMIDNRMDTSLNRLTAS